MRGLTADQLQAHTGTPIYTSDGEHVGEIGEVWYDETTGQAEWLKTGRDRLGLRDYWVPLRDAELRDEKLLVPYTKQQLQDSPDLGGADIDDARAADLHRSYGIESESVTRSEEELAVGKREVETGRARLRKWVETQPVSVDVELQRETARVVREQLDQPVDDAAFQEEEVEVPLRAEEPVVEKHAVAKERVALETDVQTEHRTVTDEVRREHVEVDER